MFWIGLVIGAFIGAAVGFVTCGLLAANREMQHPEDDAV